MLLFKKYSTLALVGHKRLVRLPKYEYFDILCYPVLSCAALYLKVGRSIQLHSCYRLSPAFIFMISVPASKKQPSP